MHVAALSHNWMHYGCYQWHSSITANVPPHTNTTKHQSSPFPAKAKAREKQANCLSTPDLLSFLWHIFLFISTLLLWHLPILHTCKGYQGWWGMWRLCQWLRQVVTARAGYPLGKHVVLFPPLCAHTGIKSGMALAVQFASIKLKPTL